MASRSDRPLQLFSNVIPSHLSLHRTAAVAMHAQEEINAISSHFNAKDFNTNLSEHMTTERGQRETRGRESYMSV